MRKIHDSQVDTSRTNSDASTQSDTIINDRSTTNMSDKVQNDRNSSLVNQTIGNLADIDNSARLLERNAPVNTELINNLVIRMSGSISSGNNKNSPSISTFQVPVPELPKIPAFEPESPNVAIDDDSVVSQITDFNFNEDKNESMTTDSIFDFFSYPQYMKKYIPSKIARETATDLVDFKNQRFRYLHHSVKKIILKVTKTFVPGVSHDEFVEAILTDIISSKIKKKGKNPKISRIKDKWERLTNVLCNVEKHSNINSIEKRVTRAILNKGLAEGDLQSLMKEHNFKFGTGRARFRAREDIKTLLNGEKLHVQKRNIVRVGDDVVRKLVDFILSPNNVVPNSYGTKKVKLSRNEVLTLPRLQRKNTRIKIYEDYKEFTMNDTSYISRETFYRIINNITACEQVSLNAIDYVTSTLVNETCEVLQDIVERIVPPINRDHASNMIHTAKYFLKHRYASHTLRDNDDICYHGLAHGLSKNAEPQINTQCQECKFPFYACNQLKRMCSSSICENELRNDALEVIDDTAEKFKLYMAHVCRCSCQSQSLHSIEKSLKKQCVDTKGGVTRALIIIDFKMKFETKSTRESTLEHYGKRGIGWHGCAVIYYLYKIKTDDKNKIVYDEHGSEIYEARKNIVYIDQIMERSNKQDGVTVISLIEAAIVAINDQMSFIDEIILQSDNALSYQNPQVLFGIHLLNVRYHNDIFISEFTHSETQDGKTLLDAHFASMNRHLTSFMKSYKRNRTTRIQTPSGLASALSFGSGVRNTMVQLVECDRQTMEEWVSIIEPTAKKAREYFSRANHIYYQKIESCEASSISEIIKQSFTIKLQSFSGIDTKVGFDVNISQNELQPNREAQNEIEAFMNGSTMVEEQYNTNVTENNSDIEDNDINEPVDDFVFESTNHKYSTRKKRSAVITYSSSSEGSSDDEEYVDTSEESDNEEYDDENKSKHYRRLRHYGPPNTDHYCSSKMITKIKIFQQQELGYVAPLARKKILLHPLLLS